MSYVSLYCLSLFNILFWLWVINRTRVVVVVVGGWLEIHGHLKKEVFFASLPICLAARRMEMSGRLLCFPWLLKLGIRAAGWAELGWVGRGERGNPAGVWLRSNPGDYYCWDTHTYTHTSAGICCWRQSWLPWFPLLRGDNVFGHSAWRAEISQWKQDKQPFITFCEHCFKAWTCMGVCIYACVCVCVHLKRPREQKETGSQRRWEV